MKLKKSQDKIIAGVCGGLADSLGVSHFKFRLVFVILSIVSVAFPGILVYLVLWFLMAPADS